MSTLFGKSVASTYKDLLQVSNNNIGVDDVVRYIEDGEGTRSALALSTDTVVLSGHLLPQVHEQVDLGSAELKFRHLYLSDNTIYIGDQTFNTTDIKVVKDIQTTATLPISSVVELAQSAAQIGDIDSTFFTDEFLNEYSTIKTQAGTAVQPNTSALFEDVTTSGNLNVGGSITGGEIITIDPAAVGDNTGKVIIAGDLQVDGETTVVNSTTISTSSSVITLAQGATDAAQADGAGVVVDGANATIKYGATNNQWILDRAVNTPSIVTESLSHSSQINLNVANNLLLDLYSDGSNSNMAVFAKTTFNDTLNVGEAVQFGPGGSVGGIVPTINGQSIVWDGAKWRPAVASTGDSEATEVPAAFTQALPTSNTIGNPPGVYTINFAQEYTAPPAITTDLQIEGDLPIIPYVITEVTTTNFTIEFAEPPASLGYTIHVTFGGRDILWKNGDLNSIYYDQGDVVVNNMEISGNLSVAGTTTTINSTDLSIRDRNITLADNTLSRDLSGVNGNAGITWGNDNKVKLLYNSDKDGFVFVGGRVGINTDPDGNSDAALTLLGYNSAVKDVLKIVRNNDGTELYTINYDQPQNRVNFNANQKNFHFNNGPSAAPNMCILADGKVGIGTTDPQQPLHIQQQGTASGNYGHVQAIVENTLTSNGRHGAGLRLISNDSGMGAEMYMSSDANNNNFQGLGIRTFEDYPIVFCTNTEAGRIADGQNSVGTPEKSAGVLHGEAMRITSSGRVGIGTTTVGDNYKLDVRGGVIVDDLRIRDTSFFVEGDTNTYYPVMIALNDSQFDFTIVRGTHTDTSSSGAINTRIWGHTSAWGNYNASVNYDHNSTLWTAPASLMSGFFVHPYENWMILYLLGGRTYALEQKQGSTRPSYSHQYHTTDAVDAMIKIFDKNNYQLYIPGPFLHSNLESTITYFKANDPSPSNQSPFNADDLGRTDTTLKKYRSGSMLFGSEDNLDHRFIVNSGGGEATAEFKSTDGGARVFLERPTSAGATWLGWRNTDKVGWLAGMENNDDSFHIYRYANIGDYVEGDAGNDAGTALKIAPDGHTRVYNDFTWRDYTCSQTYGTASIAPRAGINGVQLFLYARDTGGGSRGCGIDYGHGFAWRPTNDNVQDLGTVDYRWDDVRATNGTIQTSDANEKNTIVDSDLGLNFIQKLSPKSYKFNDKTRTHYGLIAQDVEQVLVDIEKDSTQFAGFCKDDIKDEDGNVTSTSYGLRYNEFISPMIKAIQEQQAIIESQNSKIEQLISRIETLENK